MANSLKFSFDLHLIIYFGDERWQLTIWIELFLNNLSAAGTATTCKYTKQLVLVPVLDENYENMVTKCPPMIVTYRDRHRLRYYIRHRHLFIQNIN